MADSADKVATEVVNKLGEAQALLVAMRLTLLIGQRAAASTDDEAMAQAAGEAISALKRMGSLAGFLNLA